jgi:hypothetical protein
MSVYDMQRALFDYLRAMENTKSGTRPELNVEGYSLTEEEKKVLLAGDVGRFYGLGVHPVIINAYCRAMGYKRADYRPLLAEYNTPSRRRTRWQTS